mmetsp:Transcript_58087/g.141989  ORF Transcript_58087/g.141989 Transcript_58087/m.141989 type:complete len:94 (-) Transcript_58087:237-518(-)
MNIVKYHRQVERNIPASIYYLVIPPVSHFAFLFPLLYASLVNPDLLDTPLIYLQRLACCKDVIVNHRWWSSFFFFDDDDEDDDDDYAWSSSRF